MPDLPSQVSSADGRPSTEFAELDRFPLSLHQDLLRGLDHGDGSGPFGPRYTIVGGWRITGELDPIVLQAALFDVVERHEALRSSIVLAEPPYHRLLRPSQPQVLVRDLTAAAGDRDSVAERFLNEIEAGPFGLDEQPLVRAVLGRFDRTDHVLVLVAHHTAVDGWSIHRVLHDLATFYTAHQEHRMPELPPARQYREYVAWQQANLDSPEIAAARAFWRQELSSGKLVGLPIDHARSGEPFVTGWHRFILGTDFTDATRTLASETRSTPFMVLLAAYLVYLRELTGETNLIVATFTPGRWPAWVQDTVGAFYNLIPIHTDITGCTSFREVVEQARASCIAAYAHEIPFEFIAEEAPTLLDAAMSEHAAVAVFQVTQSPLMMMTGQRFGDLTYRAMRRRVQSAPVGSQLPDGMLWGLELSPDGEILGSVGYTTNVLTEPTVQRMTAQFCQVLQDNIGS